MRLTKNDMARVVVQALFGMKELPAADSREVRSRARRGTVASLKADHKKSVAILDDLRRKWEADAIADKWVARFGYGFHPDTRGEDYFKGDERCLSDAEAAEYDADMDALSGLADDQYETGLQAMKRAGIDID